MELEIVWCQTIINYFDRARISPSLIMKYNDRKRRKDDVLAFFPAKLQGIREKGMQLTCNEALPIN